MMFSMYWYGVGQRVGWLWRSIWSMDLTFAFLFIMYQEHLIHSLFLFYRSIILVLLPHVFLVLSKAAHIPSPTWQGEIEGLHGCALMCLILAVVTIFKTEENQRQCKDQQQQGPSIKSMKINGLSFRFFFYQRLLIFLGKCFFLFVAQVFDVK